ncbi:subunit VIb of cytochrome c oxidase [Mitosporidium daphniae]|uniref:Subunit VIb of cytochrome c oxidase n=1 Tax=Mitosporidium daphniae TaxID=1485682 RepID=A0A098VMA4_9MICR|nr:subunit VIb of cytochrome c oxidase [Mitosporidium daphniae]KGG50227.1 subunit VIb of cytochrome c oxidase [Mitosporidium daphniae]|eukprot:XP_013236710.1 subunit VIb of cytochrome c oxidase [Mitosporidium daphniae]
MTPEKDLETCPAASRLPRSRGSSYNREERDKCWKSKERYFECLDKKGDANCGGEYEEFSKRCPEVWVNYFVSKRTYTIRMEEAKKRLEEEISKSTN